MEEITRINHIGLRVSDFKTSIDFFAKLGFEYVAGPIGPEPVGIAVHPCGININFILNANQPDKTNILMDVETQHTGYTHIAIEVSDVKSIMKKLEALAIPLSGGPIDTPTGTSVFIRDPDKNVIEFIEYIGLAAFK